ncbi:hypothetical protein F5Y16DRAFT_423619 [Xylariaceae sp. FL0255]|nr:hypothetical protein F5Y16DRAFT_423619 [Xylariaceae sp. FL0255]
MLPFMGLPADLTQLRDFIGREFLFLDTAHVEHFNFLTWREKITATAAMVLERAGKACAQGNVNQVYYFATVFGGPDSWTEYKDATFHGQWPQHPFNRLQPATPRALLPPANNSARCTALAQKSEKYNARMKDKNLYMPEDSVLPSDESMLKDDLKALKHDKWGWVVYRTTYANNDRDWADFKRHLDESTRTDILNCDTPELIRGLEGTYVEDLTTLNDVSCEQLRARFRAWASNPETVRAEQPRAENSDIEYASRYRYFIQIDDEALESFKAGFEHSSGAFVRLIDGFWTPLSSWFPPDAITPCYYAYEPVEGFTEQDVGWMNISWDMVGAAFYQAMCGVSEIWYLYYERPPEVSWH